jgi:hypothetical protein
MQNSGEDTKIRIRSYVSSQEWTVRLLGYGLTNGSVIVIGFIVSLLVSWAVNSV